MQEQVLKNHQLYWIDLFVCFRVLYLSSGGEKEDELIGRGSSKYFF